MNSLKLTRLELCKLALGALGLMVLALGCTKAATTSNSTNTAASVQYQNPTVNCQVLQGTTPLFTVTNLASAGFSSTPQAPVQISLDCTGSASHSSTPLAISYSINGGPMTAFPSGLKDLNDPNLDFATHGAYSIEILATDGTGLTTKVNFSLPVSCNPASYNPLAFPAGTNVTLTAGSDGAGYANISLPSATGGTGNFEYAIDVNGDGGGTGRFDYYSPVANQSSPPPEYWNPTPSWQNVYNFYSGSRTMYVQVYDTSCQFVSTFPFSVNWETTVLPNPQTGPMTAIPPVEPYYYLQANVSSLSSSGDPAETVTPFDARELFTGNPSSNYFHVLCNWQDQVTTGGQSAPTNGVFNITATNVYSDGVANDTSQLTESMSLSFSIPDSAATTLGPVSVPLSSTSYQTATSPNATYQQFSYSQNSSGCTAYVQVTKQSSPTVCAGQSNNGYTWGNATVQGTFSCPNMKSGANGSPAGRNLALSNGYFYCQTGPGDDCVGSGQEGGTPPTGF